MTDKTATDQSIDKEEFDERLSEIEGEGEDLNTDNLPELLSFSDLLEMRDDLNDVGDGLDQAANYWAQVTLVLEEQFAVAKKLGETEKQDAISNTLKKAREAAQRIDRGEALSEMRERNE